LRVELGYALIPMRGWGSPETAQAFSRAGELCRQIGDSPSQFRALWGLGAFHFVRGDQRKAREVAVQCLDLARQLGDEDALIEAHYLMGIVECVRGQFVAGCAELDESVRRYGRQPRAMHRVLYGQDAKASALGWLALALCVTGHPDEAIATAYEALDFVRDTDQPFLVARGLAGVGFVRVFRREPGGPDTELPAAQALCAEQRFTYFHAVVSTFQGTNLVLLGNAQEGIAMTDSSMRALEAMGSELFATPIYAHLASAHLALGHVEEALAAVDAGLACVERNDERWAESELLRVKGEVLGVRDSDGTEAESCLRQAIAVARGQSARSYELRAATALAKHQIRNERTPQARAVLNETLSWWPPGLVTPDLSDARALLAGLA
jgi:adenylate cyclase